LGYLDGRKPHMYLIVSRLRSLLRPVTVGNLATMFSVVYISIHACLWMDDIGTTVGIFLHNHISKLLYMNMFMCIHIYHSISTYIHKYPALSLSLFVPRVYQQISSHSKAVTLRQLLTHTSGRDYETGPPVLWSPTLVGLKRKHTEKHGIVRPIYPSIYQSMMPTERTVKHILYIYIMHMIMHKLKYIYIHMYYYYCYFYYYCVCTETFLLCTFQQNCVEQNDLYLSFDAWIKGSKLMRSGCNSLQPGMGLFPPNLSHISYGLVS